MSVFHVNLGENVANVLRIYVIVKKGTRVDHPSGMACYKHPVHGTAVGIWEDGTFNLKRFYS